MSFQLLFKQEKGAIPREKIWVGFIYQFEEVVDHISKPQYNSIEINTIGLAVNEEKRLINGFNFPIDLRNKNKINPQVIGSLYIGINNIDSVFSRIKFLDSIKLVVAAKNGENLSVLGGETSVIVFSEKSPEGLVLDIYPKYLNEKAIEFSIAEGKDSIRRFALGERFNIIKNYPGDIDKFCIESAFQLYLLRLKPAQNTVSLPPLVVLEPVVVSQTSLPAPIPPLAAELKSTPTTALSLQLKSSKAPSSLPVTDSVPAPLRPFFLVLVGVLTISFLAAAAWWFLKKPLDVTTLSQTTNTNNTGTNSIPNASENSAIVSELPVKKQDTQVTPPIKAEQSNVEPAIVAEPPVNNQDKEIPSIPRSGQTISREQLGQLGYPEHLAKIKLALVSAQSKDWAMVDQSRQWLISNKQISFLPSNEAESKQIRVARRYFNEALEKKIIRAQANKDPKELKEAIVLLNDFLLENFGSANAHLNLAVAYIEADQYKFALPPAFHAIVFNPDGANGWLQLAIVLAIGGEVANGTAAMCIVLKMVDYSERTVGLFKRIEEGSVYNKRNVKEAITSTRTMCPGNGWI